MNAFFKENFKLFIDMTISERKKYLKKMLRPVQLFFKNHLHIDKMKKFIMRNFRSGNQKIRNIQHIQ